MPKTPTLALRSLLDTIIKLGGSPIAEKVKRLTYNHHYRHHHHTPTAQSAHYSTSV